MVAVKGMKMPKNCMECLLFDDEYGDCNIMGEPKANMTEERAKNCPLVSTILIPEGATNGDMIKAIFPNVECGKDELGNVFIISSAQLGYIAFRETWWNAPYKKGEENA